MSENETRVHFRVIRFMYESGLRLHMKSVPLATAAVLIAMASLYLAGKVEEEHIKLRDVINVCYRNLHKSKPPLEMGEAFWSLRDCVSDCEKFLLRMLQFKVVFNHPHRYMLHYLKYLRDWFDPYTWEDIPITRTAWALLRDSYHGNICLKYKPQHIAIALIYFSLTCHGIEVPHQEHVDNLWWQVFAEDITLDKIQDIISDTIDIYKMETTIQS
ncbi:hypothetical protein KUTeg_020791 [Tegillarca granosa]|uniref:Cyclin-Q n=1 Tax=Tegillarca granosa TaxID=220873 RepID=A0ABQ9E8Y6_TEGGR|nr:hypothetical protein KUTeg_020791 [Tegillarca granosa]